MGYAPSPFLGVVAVHLVALTYPGSDFSPTFSPRSHRILGVSSQRHRELGEVSHTCRIL